MAESQKWRHFWLFPMNLKPISGSSVISERLYRAACCGMAASICTLSLFGKQGKHVNKWKIAPTTQNRHLVKWFNWHEMRCYRGPEFNSYLLLTISTFIFFPHGRRPWVPSFPSFTSQCLVSECAMHSVTGVSRIQRNNSISEILRLSASRLHSELL